MKKQTGPKILYWDLETAPLEVYSWGLWDVNVALNQIITEWSILSVAWSWGDGPVKQADNRNKTDPRDDQDLLSLCWFLLDKADIVVSQNGVKFDSKKMNARFIMNGFPPPSPYRHVDTKIVGKSVFGFTSNRLEWMGKNLAGVSKSAHKKFPGFELWSEALKGNRAAWREMAEYNRVDVEVLRAVYKKMRPWIKSHPDVSQYNDSDLTACPKCGSLDLKPRGFAYTPTGKYQRYCCAGCGGWTRGSDNLASKTKRKNAQRGV